MDFYLNEKKNTNFKTNCSFLLFEWQKNNYFIQIVYFISKYAFLFHIIGTCTLRCSKTQTIFFYHLKMFWKVGNNANTNAYYHIYICINLILTKDIKFWMVTWSLENNFIFWLLHPQSKHKLDDELCTKRWTLDRCLTAKLMQGTKTSSW